MKAVWKRNRTWNFPVQRSTSVQQTRVLEESQRQKPRETDYLSIVSLLCEIFAGCIFVERWTGALQVQPFFQNK